MGKTFGSGLALALYVRALSARRAYVYLISNCSISKIARGDVYDDLNTCHRSEFRFRVPCVMMCHV